MGDDILNEVVVNTYEEYLGVCEKYNRDNNLPRNTQLGLLQTWNMHIRGFLIDEKVDIEAGKVDIQNKKVDIERVLFEKGKDFSVKTTVHIHSLFEKFGFDKVFGRSAVMELLELKSSGASKLISNLVQSDIIEPVSGHGKGKYKFKR